MNTIVKSFSQLTTDELYAILRLRAQVFVVEQDCVYQDVDNKDQKALHVIGRIDDEVVAYTRIFGPGDYFDQASIGRVVTDDAHRGKALGKQIMQESIAAIQLYYNETTIKISAQCYLGKFYNDLGFTAVGEEYLEDGIPHVGMVRGVR